MSTEVPRKNGNTAQLLKHAMDGAREAGAEVELVNLYDRSLNYKGSMSCFACKIKGGKKGICSFKDDQQPIQRNLVYTGIIKVMRILYHCRYYRGIGLFHSQLGRAKAKYEVEG